MGFEPKFTITSGIANALMRIEAAREAIRYLPITPLVLATLRKTARLYSTHYDALTIGPSHNYYEGRAGADITKWVAYFCDGMADSFENVKTRAREAAGLGMPDQSPLLRQLDPRMRTALELFRPNQFIASSDVERLFGVSQRTARNLLSGWVAQGLVLVADPAKKSRKYRLAGEFLTLLK